ncbi:MAG: membrane protein insertase YidC, partial [Candidatus Melainabacteria bacterium]|nr:membrane protein insertase YidC [Candidatus Melainabacteria bacterium]
MNFDLLIYYFMLPLLEFFAKVTHSYGMSIILLTLAVRMIVWPLVAKSTRSMQAMSR